MLPLSYEVIDKSVLGAPDFLEGGYTPYFGHTFPNRTYFRACGRFWLSAV